MQHLPVDDFLPQIRTTLSQNQNLILTAAPGAGKTTRVPVACAQQFHGKILVLEPRRVAAIAAASRICEENNWNLGEECGYQVRFENRSHAGTQILFQTEALLTKRLIEDPDLTGIDLIILDEFHERSAHVDLALGAIREMQLLGHPIRLLVMSATLDAVRISEFLGQAPILDIPGTLQSLDIQYSKQSQLLRTDSQFYERLSEQIKFAYQSSKRDLLIFLPGVSEIQRAIRELSPWIDSVNSNYPHSSSCPQVLAYALHGSMSLSEQKQVLKPEKNRRLLFATNIAESSLTLDGVDTVIDSGLAKIMRWDPRTGFSRLKLERISQFSAKQRAGRAARQYPGKVYRMWTLQDEQSMPLDIETEVQRIDLTDSLLLLLCLGVFQPQSFSWFQIPPRLHLEKALAFLKESAHCELDSSGQIRALTEKAKTIANWPMGARLGCLYWNCLAQGISNLGAFAVAILQERDFIKPAFLGTLIAENSDCDIVSRYESVDVFSKSEVNAAVLSQIRQAQKQILSLSSKAENIDSKLLEHGDLRQAWIRSLALTYQDRLCRRRGSSTKAQMINGRGVRLAEESVVKNSEFFFALDGVESTDNTETLVRWASGLSKTEAIQLFANQIKRKRQLRFDQAKGQVLAEEFRCIINRYGELAIDDPVQVPMTEEEKLGSLPLMIEQQWDQRLKSNSALYAWMMRWEFICSYLQSKPELYQKFNLANDDDLRNLNWTSEKRRSAFELLCMGQNNIDSIFSKNVIWAFEQQVPTSILELVTKEFPLSFSLPSGSELPIQYSMEQGAFLEVRLQEIFGWTETPTLAFGHLPISLHLLAPNYRPVQMTKDLMSFWKNVYPEIRGQLRARYPKHSWPDDPLTAAAVAKGRSRIQSR